MLACMWRSLLLPHRPSSLSHPPSTLQRISSLIYPDHFAYQALYVHISLLHLLLALIMIAICGSACTLSFSFSAYLFLCVFICMCLITVSNHVCMSGRRFPLLICMLYRTHLDSTYDPLNSPSGLFLSEGLHQSSMSTRGLSVSLRLSQYDHS